MLPAHSEIKLVCVGAVDGNLLEYLALTLPETIGIRCAAVSITMDPQEAYDERRRQFHSTQLLAKLREIEAAVGYKVLGVTEVDLFIPIFTFVFGEAQVGGSAALMSTHRLHQEFYGLPKDASLLFARAEKEAVHELGHTYGLAHCCSFDCVMRFSNSVEQVDLKPCNFCQLCAAQLRDRSGSTLAA
jgi:archaemetzincin